MQMRRWAREYIFSENVGVLGDIAAGKEQTFGTLTQRIMATIGGRVSDHPLYFYSYTNTATTAALRTS